jgi:hypothetical protein
MHTLMKDNNPLIMGDYDILIGLLWRYIGELWITHNISEPIPNVFGIIQDGKEVFFYVENEKGNVGL